MFTTISARQIQREYKSVLEQANKSKDPIIVMSNNKPQGAIIGLDLLEKIQLDLLLEQGMKEYRAGKTKRIATREDLEKEFEEIRNLANSS